MTKKISTSKDSQSRVKINDSTGFKFPSGIVSGNLSREVIKAIISEMNPEFFQLSELERLDRTGTRALREKVSALNPLDYISKLRKINGFLCIRAKEVPEARKSPYGSPPVYYWMDAETIAKWKKALGGDYE
jgi:hypothetical protein